ncbi:hypothetical protein [Pseudoalteromonas ulvae]|uniref:Uncharacterized protein n=1 Tax=Pseudoalteromonas ulvae TaxID=107327 RepID=A0A244CMY4_PSEDV|nr:hypothetical protein [Pseudoalteromonas ulvae]OUL56569.1 hypothetical protein B1199_18080 [Pseudoalteromonas ulvae]
MKAVWRTISLLLVSIALFFCEQINDRTALEHAFTESFAAQLHSQYKHAAPLPNLDLSNSSERSIQLAVSNVNEQQPAAAMIPEIRSASPSTFLYPSQVNPIYWLVIEFFIWVFALLSMLSLIAHRPIPLWFIHIYRRAKSRISGWHESNRLYSGCHTNYS